MKVINVFCDACDTDLTSTEYVPGYRLILEAEIIPHTGQVVAAIAIYPPIKKAHHFCDRQCLEKWLQMYKNSPPLG